MADEPPRQIARRVRRPRAHAAAGPTTDAAVAAPAAPERRAVREDPLADPGAYQRALAVADEGWAGEGGARGFDALRAVRRATPQAAEPSPPADPAAEEPRGEATASLVEAIRAAVAAGGIAREAAGPAFVTLTPTAYDVHLVLDSRYTKSSAAELAAGVLRFDLGGGQTTIDGRVRTIRDLSAITEIQIAPFSFPRDTPWAASAPALTARDELSVLVREYTADSYETPGREANHHFRGWFDSTETAAYLHYFNTAAATIAADISAHNNALVRWYEPAYQFGYPVSVTSNEITLECRRSDNPVPFYGCEFRSSGIECAGGGGGAVIVITVGVESSELLANTLGANDVIVLTQTLYAGTPTEIVLAAGTQYTIGSIAIGATTTQLRLTATSALVFTKAAAISIVIPKYRFRMNMRARGVTTDARTTHRRP
jgi:hypothetical protein